MEELTDQAKQMLDALKAEETPSKASSDRMWGALAGGAAAGAIVGLSKGKLLMLGALGVTGVVALVLFTGQGPDDESDTASTDPGARGGAPVVAVDEPEPEPEPELELVEPEPEPELVEPAPEPAPEPASEPAREERAPKASATPAPEPAPTNAVEGSADLERELSLLAEAKGALRRGDAQGALRRLKAHRKEFPRSTFGEERDLLRMTALCEVGERDEARREAKSFLKRNPSSALTAQVRRVCEGE
jgi:hypothetical protein